MSKFPDFIIEDNIIGEISTSYYAFPQSAELIYQTIPHVKILAILRNSCDRAFSAYQMFVRAGHEKKSFTELCYLPTLR